MLTIVRILCCSRVSHHPPDSWGTSFKRNLTRLTGVATGALSFFSAGILTTIFTLKMQEENNDPLIRFIQFIAGVGTSSLAMIPGSALGAYVGNKVAKKIFDTIQEPESIKETFLLRNVIRIEGAILLSFFLFVSVHSLYYS